MKLHEVVAVRKGIKSRTYAEMTKSFKQVQKGPLFQGLRREFTPVDDDAENFPTESKPVQASTAAAIKAMRRLRTEFLDIEATQEYGNQQAGADVEIDGTVILTRAPVTLLIFLEKELNDWHNYVAAMPTLDQDKTWTKDPNSELFRSEPVRTHKTKKVQRPIVMYDATPEHPAQTQLISEDVTIGHWTTTHLSSALPRPEKERILARILALQDAIKRARARGNEMKVERVEIGAKLLNFVFDTK